MKNTKISLITSSEQEKAITTNHKLLPTVMIPANQGN